jgi:glucosyl-dolichyl phosphate glucuronosyltransferase
MRADGAIAIDTPGSAARRRPDVSAVISTFNRCESLSRTLDSLLAQEVPEGLDYEIIVVDNNASDLTRSVVARYRALAPGRVRYVFERRQGVSYGRNCGIRVSRAAIIAFTDDDIKVGPRWIETIKMAMDAHPEAAAVGGKILPEWPSAVPPVWLTRQHWGPLSILDYGDQPFYTSSSDPRCLLTANLAVRREVFDRIGPFSPAFQRCQDHELQIRLWRASERVLYVPDLVVRTHIADERLTRRYHRHWHARHGRYAALMRLQEIIDSSGKLIAPRDAVIRLYGTPGFVYREFMAEAFTWLTSLVRFDRSGGAHRHQLQYLANYIRRAAMAERRSIRECVTEPFAFAAAHLRRRAAGVAMSPRRVVLAAALVTATAFGSLYDIATDQEHWPFSPYAMFSYVEDQPTLRVLRLFGVTGDASLAEFPLLDSRFIQPFDQCRLATALAGTYYNVARRPSITLMLRDVLERYERLRLAGFHDGPPLQAIRLYELEWTLDPRAANLTVPDRRQQLAEVQLTAEMARR